jgi:hypothetical protein
MPSIFNILVLRRFARHARGKRNQTCTKYTKRMFVGGYEVCGGHVGTKGCYSCQPSTANVCACGSMDGTCDERCARAWSVSYTAWDVLGLASTI